MAHASTTSRPPPPLHVAIVMDGNGRWAARRGLPRIAGHRAGADAVRQTVEAAGRLGVRVLTLFAFSSDNWQRPAGEVSTLMDLLRLHLRREIAHCRKHGVRIRVIGRRDRLGRLLRSAIDFAETATASGTALDLRVAVDYSARDIILRAVSIAGNGRPPSRAEFARRLAAAANAGHDSPDVDLMIRTGGEQRLSDFLLWECAYAEFVFTPVMWPDFGATDLEAAIHEFQQRDRRFGRVRESDKEEQAGEPLVTVSGG